MPQPGIEPGPLDLQSNALPTELSRHVVNSTNAPLLLFFIEMIYKDIQLIMIVDLF